MASENLVFKGVNLILFLIVSIGLFSMFFGCYVYQYMRKRALDRKPLVVKPPKIVRKFSQKPRANSNGSIHFPTSKELAENDAHQQQDRNKISTISQNEMTMVNHGYDHSPSGEIPETKVLQINSNTSSSKETPF